MKKSLMFLMTLVAQPALATENLEQQIQLCRQYSQSADRLQCYDAIGLASRTAELEQNDRDALSTDATDLRETNTAKSSTAQTATHVVASPSTETFDKSENTGTSEDNRFGLEHKAIQYAELDSITAKILNATHYRPNKLSIQLDNGQIWRQIDSKKLLLKKGTEVIISRGVANSYFLEKASGSRKIRISRKQ